MKVNILALVGAFVGLLCILLPWTVTTVTFLSTSSTTELALTDYIHDGDSTFAFAVVLFLVGCAFSFITPLGGFAQFFGWAAFMVLIAGRLGTVQNNALTTTTVSLSAGAYVGIVAAAIVLFSMVRPLGLGYGRAALQPRERFLVWSD